MALESLHTVDKTFTEALAEALRSVVPEPTRDPVHALAASLIAHSDATHGEHDSEAKHMMSDSAAYESKLGDEDGAHGGAGAAAEAAAAEAGGEGAAAAEEAEEQRRRQRQAGRARRTVVFSEPVRMDDAWTPPVIPKSDAERAAIAAAMGRVVLFSGVDEDALQQLVSAMAPRTFAAGDRIITQGETGDYYYIITAGSADITVNGKLVLQIGAGAGFGELALLYDSPRAATVTATATPTATWTIDRVSFKRLLVGATMRKRELYEGFLRAVPILSTLTQEEILTLADALQPVHVKAGDTVVRQGDADADRFFLVESGELAATMAGVEGEVCDRLRAGSYFGERALLTDEPRAATVTAVTDSRCLAMDRAAFLRLLGPLAEVLQRNMEVYDKYVR